MCISTPRYTQIINFYLTNLVYNYLDEKVLDRIRYWGIIGHYYGICNIHNLGKMLVFISNIWYTECDGD